MRIPHYSLLQFRRKPEEQDLHAHSAYVGKEQEKTIAKYKLNNKVHEKGYRKCTANRQQMNKKSNKEKSKTRARVEHVFGLVDNA